MLSNIMTEIQNTGVNF